ncbi:MAG: DUF3320 domain-containing protein [bacterium]|nr:DUF3320 domain-containing protein [bacterium]
MQEIVTVEGQFASSINFAMQQNYVPVIRSLIVINHTEKVIEDLTLKISFEPEFAKDYIYKIRKILPKESQEIQPVRIVLSTEYLFSLTEKVVGCCHIELYQEGETLYSERKEIELLSLDQWSGLHVMPELVTAFITPNHPRVTELLNKAINILKQWTGRPEFTGYQTKNPDCVKQQMAAIYAALLSEGIAYTAPIASYEESGQRIRLPYMVLQCKQGTCLDLAVLYCACLEAAGLYPLLIFVKDHAYAGCWLEEQTFADCAVDDVSALDKRTVEGGEELLLVECTDFVISNHLSFELAIKHGKDHLKKGEDFIYAIDVKRSRGSGIRPIPLKNPSVDNEEVSGDINAIKEHTLAPKEMDVSLKQKEIKEETELTKQKLWERKLLDFSLRNTLLNFRVTKNAIQFMTVDLCQLEDQLSEGKDFCIMEVPVELKTSMRDGRMFEIENEKGLIQTIATNEFKSNRIRTFLEAEELNKNLKSLHRTAKVSMEENGTNTLFLALGFLRWFESDVSEKARYAPIILLPIELVRNRHSNGYIIRSRQEEAQINITLLEYLRQDFNILVSGLDPLPMDDNGIDLPLVFHTIRQAIMGKKRWNIEEMTFMGVFSFGQFVMWNDLRNRSKELETNKVVKSLMEGKVTWKNESQLVTAEALDQKVSPLSMAIPLSADSSQMVAIAAAANGTSFVLHGAPGTGKSQTITNMIANTLNQGKSVLFVAEKMAALNVVKKRLVSIGLEPFCLELHSNKTSKGSVLGQLDQALEVGRIKAPEEYEKTAKRLDVIRNELNYIMEAIHCKRDYGKSLYEAIELFEQNKQQKDKICFDNLQVADIDGLQIEQWMEEIRQYVIAAAEIKKYSLHPFVGYEGKEYSMEIRDQLETELNHLLHFCDQISEWIKWLEEWSGLKGKQSRTDMQLLLYLCSEVANPAVTLERLIKDSNFEELKQKYIQLIEAGQEYTKRYNEVMESFLPQVLEYNTSDALLRWKRAETSWFLRKFREKRRLQKELMAYAKDPKRLEQQSMVQYYQQLALTTKRKAQVSALVNELNGYLDGLYQGVQTNWKEVSEALNKAESIRRMTKGLSEEEKDRFIKASMDQDHKKEVQERRLNIQQFLERLETFKSVYHVTFLSGERKGENWIQEVKEVLLRYQSNLSQLRSWVTYNQKEEQLYKCGLSCVAAAFRKGDIEATQITSAFTANLYYRLLLHTIQADQRLQSFRGKQYEDWIIQYKELITKFEQLTSQELVARLSEKIPLSGMESISSSELGILKHAIKSNGRMMSIRRLFNQIPNLLRRLCPCMLMSPISVAQYIDPSFPKFDLVIFDEASQLPTCEAIGTIARAENVVVVGDPKQLPPTYFFMSNRMDEENCEKEDLESLLDDCLAISMPQEYLKWHYRSRHESLIAFSNRKYYDNRLFTFPSPNDLVSEVKLIHVDGYYDKGKTKQNKQEAKAVVAEIIRRLKDQNLRNDSIGVVTFSSVQQNLIDDLLADEFAKNPELEEFDSKSSEPVFIKNLENVQGDERDVILFSIGYGPDKNGNVSMNFGPLNREGGWRRLNVAISRARKQMLVFATIRPEQIELSRTRAEGLAGLKGFLEFAERGKNVVVSKSTGTTIKEDAIQQEIAAAITNMGYNVKYNIGCSEYKLDLAIVNPNNSDQYILGILLDGENCRKASTAKDRFILQPEVLEGLGWNLMRIWVLEWIDNPEDIKRQIKEKMEDIMEKRVEIKSEAKTLAMKAMQFEKLDVHKGIKSLRSTYETAEIKRQGVSSEFNDPKNLERIRSIITEILKKEAPISRKLLLKKLLSTWEITRNGKRVETTFDIALAGIEKRVTKDGETLFYWLPDQEPKQYDKYRVEDQFGVKRAMEDISSYEIANAIEEVLEEQIGIKEHDMVRLTAKKFGYGRPGNVIIATITHALYKTVEQGRVIQNEDGKLVLPERIDSCLVN